MTIACDIRDWHVSNTKEYALTLDEAVQHDGNETVRLQSRNEAPKKECFISQEASPEPFRGGKVSFSAWVKTELNLASVQLWLRVDVENAAEKDGCFDNMYQSRIKRSADWQQITLTVNAPSSSTKIFFGLILLGDGKVWLAEPRLSQAE
jgi:AraC family transcriptional regulator